MPHYRKIALGFLIVAATACLRAGAPAARGEAELILKNGRVWTGDPQDPWAEAIAIRHNHIIAVGNNTDVAALAGSDARVIDLAGRLTLPGFNDAHVHFVTGAMRLLQADLTGACAVADLEKRIRDWAAAHPRDPWVVAGNWDPGCAPDHRLPTRVDLDSVVKDRPVFVASEDGHTAWVNTKALQAAGITRATRPEGNGRVIADATGEPTGILRDSAQTLVRKAIPPASHERRLAALDQEAKVAASLGITSLQNAGGDDETLLLLEDLERERRLNLRVAVALSVPPTSTPDTIDHLLELKQLYHDSRLRVTAAEFVMDGNLAAHTAAVLEPWADERGNGTTNWSQDAWNAMLALCDSGGLQLWTHAAGDRAVRMALDGYEFVRRTDETRDARFRIERTELIAPADVPRFARLGVLAVMAPIHADPGALEEINKAVGPQRLGLLFPWQTLEQAGARVAFSSDWPASLSLDPIRGISSAVNRTGPQRLAVENAVRAYTVTGAWASFEDHIKGRLKRGMLADIVVLSQNLFSIDPRQIAATKVDMTIFDGQVTYTRQ